MSYIDLANNFWNAHRQQTMSSADTVLFFGLLHLSYKEKWPSELKRSDGSLQSLLHITRPALIKSRKVLRDRELIRFAGGHNPFDMTHYILLESPSDDRVVSRPANESQVYLAYSDAMGLYKIGTSADVPSRIRQLQTPLYSVRLIHTFPGGRMTEQKVHERFTAQRVFGEWFHLSTAEVDRFIEIGKALVKWP